MDKLETIFEMQKELNKSTFQKNNLISFDEIPKDSKTQDEWLAKFALAMSQEIAELMDCTNWKWWRSKVDLFDKQNAAVELIDILHFWVSACQVLGLSANDVFQIYAQKNAVNLQRQESGYVTKNANDCRHIDTKNKYKCI